MEAIRSFETSVLTSATRRYMPEDGILHSPRRENLNSYMDLFPTSGDERETSTLCVPIQRANLNHLSIPRDPTEQVSLSRRLRTETDPVSEMLFSSI
jgi:hypothetical protein